MAKRLNLAMRLDKRMPMDTHAMIGAVAEQATYRNRSILASPICVLDQTNAIGKYFRASAGKRINARGFKLLERLPNRKPGALRKICDLDHGKGLQMHLRKALLQSGTQIEEILKWKIRVQAADNMKFSDCLAVSRSSGRESLIQRHGVSAG